MKDVTETVLKFNGEKLGRAMLFLWARNYANPPATEAEVSDTYKAIMQGRGD